MSLWNIKETNKMNNKKQLEDHVKEMGRVSYKMMEKHHEAEESCVLQVLCKHLDRKPTDEDYKNCTRMFGKSKMDYILCHLDTKLGVISKTFEGNPLEKDGFKFRVQFSPDITGFDE